jgi:hypothetical protein
MPLTFYNCFINIHPGRAEALPWLVLGSTNQRFPVHSTSSGQCFQAFAVIGAENSLRSFALQHRSNHPQEATISLSPVTALPTLERREGAVLRLSSSCRALRERTIRARQDVSAGVFIYTLG